MLLVAHSSESTAETLGHEMVTLDANTWVELAKVDWCPACLQTAP
jgi:hypothetical protein